MALSNKHWKEDFNLKNGKYICKCATCHFLFYGLKTRLICKECFDKAKILLPLPKVNNHVF